MAVPSIKTGRKGRISKELKFEVMGKLKKLVESGKILGVSNYHLSKEFNIQRETIGKYLDQIYKSVPKDDLHKVYIDFKLMFDKLFKIVNRLLDESITREDYEKNIKLILELIREKTKLLENFFIKQKAIDNIALKAEVEYQLVIE